jgi:hypothetical protein
VSSKSLIEGVASEYFQSFPEARFHDRVALDSSFKGTLE